MSGGSSINETSAANDSIGTAQAVATLPVAIAGKISSNTDNDYFRVTVPAGKKMTSTLTAGSGSGFGLGVYLTNGQQLILVSGVIGRRQQIMLTNAGKTPVTVVMRVMRSAGTTGAYKLAMTL